MKRINTETTQAKTKQIIKETKQILATMKRNTHETKRYETKRYETKTKSCKTKRHETKHPCLRPIAPKHFYLLA